MRKFDVRTRTANGRPYTTLLGIVLAFALSACGDTGNAPEGPRLSEDGTEFIYEHIFKKGGKAVLTAAGRFPKTGADGVDRYYQDRRDDFHRLCEEMAEGFAGDIPYEMEEVYIIERNDDVLFSVLREVHVYTGGAHGYTAVYCETFSRETGELLALDDFFAAGREEYTALLLRYVDAKIDERPGDYWEDAKRIAREEFPYDTFVVTDDGVALIFPEYAVAPFATGTVRVDIPWSAAGEMLVLPTQ
jgi:hypothetical protein